MSHIEKTIIDYLLDPDTDMQTNATRQAARYAIAGTVGQNVFLGHGIQSVDGLFIVVNRYSNQRFNDVAAEDSLRFSRLDVTAWGRGPGVGLGLLDLAENIRLALVDYCDYMGGTRIFEISINGDGIQTAIPPDDKSDNWMLSYATDLEVAHQQAVSINPVLGE